MTLVPGPTTSILHRCEGPVEILLAARASILTLDASDCDGATSYDWSDPTGDGLPLDEEFTNIGISKDGIQFEEIYNQFQWKSSRFGEEGPPSHIINLPWHAKITFELSKFTFTSGYSPLGVPDPNAADAVNLCMKLNGVENIYWVPNIYIFNGKAYNVGSRYQTYKVELLAGPVDRPFTTYPDDDLPHWPPVLLYNQYVPPPE